MNHPLLSLIHRLGGTEPQRQTVVNYFKDIHAIPDSEIDCDNVMVTAGGQQAMAAALRSISPGTKVLASKWEYAPVSGIASDAQ